jgi:hypothetical protein
MESARDSSGSVDAETEARAIASLVEAFRQLDRAAVERVLDWAAKRYGRHAGVDGPVSGEVIGASPPGGEARGEGRRGDLAEVYTAADPKTEAESVLIAAYWHHVAHEADALDSQALNRALKNLGRGVGNVTRACSVLIARRPALMLQVKKTGSTKQARKQYRLTVAGFQRAREMLGEGDRRTGRRDEAAGPA